MNINHKIYKKLLEVPKGQVTTYGDLAKAAGIKNGQRVVGRMMNKNPYPGMIPCHRVILSSGDVGGYAYGKDIKTNMLINEGIIIKNGKILNLEKRLHKF